MARGISLHIGLNHVDPAAYNGWDGALAGCINDANAMKRIADGLGYQSSILTEGQGTSARVVEGIGQAARQLAAGDMFLLTYSGHGGQVPDSNGDDADGRDETWVLYDRMLIDDELYSLFAQFAAGVRIFMLSDSCHSGTVARMVMYREACKVRDMLRTGARDASVLPEPPKTKAIPQQTAAENYRRHRDTYDTLQWVAGRSDRADVAASVLLISGCQDNQLSLDGAVNGLFTEKLLQVWNNSAFAGGYEQFWRRILELMPPDQTPNFYKVGREDPAFEAQRPFTIGAGSSGTSPAANPAGGPSISTSPTWNRTGGPPSFQVQAGGKPYFEVEVASRADLFNHAANGGQRNASNFYATWNPSDHPGPRLSRTQFTLPDDAWQRLCHADRLFFRVHTCSGPSGWDTPHTVSTPDASAASAPCVQLVDSTSPQPSPAPEPNPTPIPTPTPEVGTTRRTLRRGDRGPEVEELQRLLTRCGFPATADGIFGPGTEQAVKSFQSSRGLTVDGIVGQQTWNALGARSAAAQRPYPVPMY